ncbi:Uncharacterized protein PECH_009018 [Penicillium ucsense]|uniref:Uncharacterized protein n=1 Tax=Penicillium ucsense TaxID=2839758 RepID=A0A8J8WHB3_9EURO|nr:Uncharacterized protein PECM_006505 [Penicillium ucsense]KAF7733738.1 Uncharacterized protein PECH_009018 [Penicillium ucsense]
MQSSMENQSMPDRTRENPSASAPFADQDTLHRPPPTADSVSQQSWKPKFDRRQSWNHEDQKHELQERLLNLEPARETGFSETGREA